jgi:hypothetical protein
MCDSVRVGEWKLDWEVEKETEDGAAQGDVHAWFLYIFTILLLWVLS